MNRPSSANTAEYSGLDGKGAAAAAAATTKGNVFVVEDDAADADAEAGNDDENNDFGGGSGRPSKAALAARERSAEQQLVELDVAFRRKRRNTCIAAVLGVSLLIAFVVMMSYSTNRSSRLWSYYNWDHTHRRYCLMSPSVSLDAPSLSAYAVGTLTMDAHKSIIELNAVLYGVYNATAVHIYGPLEPGSLNAPQAVALNSDLAADYAPMQGGSGRVHVRVRPLEPSDIDRVYANPVLYYVGVSTITHPHGNGVRFSLGIECNE